MTNERKFPLKMLFRAMPEDVYKALIVRQAKEKLRLNRMVSLEQTAYRMIKEAANNKSE
jgi:ribosomal protein L14